jgi:hypothetical protein
VSLAAPVLLHFGTVSEGSAERDHGRRLVQDNQLHMKWGSLPQIVLYTQTFDRLSALGRFHRLLMPESGPSCNDGKQVGNAFPQGLRGFLRPTSGLFQSLGADRRVTSPPQLVSPSDKFVLYSPHRAIASRWP